MAFTTLSDVYTDIRFKTNRTSTDLADATLLPIANKVLREIYAALIGMNEDWYAEIAIFNLVADQREYTLPADSASTPWGGGAIKVLRLEVKMDGTNWTVANHMKFTDDDTPYNETNIIAKFTNSNPFFTILDNSLFIFSGTITAVTTGARLIYIKRNSELTTGTDVPDLPNEWLTLMSTGICRDVYERYGDLQKWQLASAQFNGTLERLTVQTAGRDQNFPYVVKTSHEDYS